jgi:hypothetical protein
MVRDGNEYLVTLFRQDAEQGTWRYSVPIAFDPAAEAFNLLAGDLGNRSFVDALHALFLVLDLVSHMMPGRVTTMEIPSDAGEPIRHERRSLPLMLHPWGEYRIPYFTNGIAYAPGVQIFADD